MDSLHLTALFTAPPDRIRQAWISAEGHAEMTGAGATSDPRPGGAYTAWDGYIEGTHLEIEPNRIVQTWRSGDFPSGAADSRLEILIDPHEGGTRVTLLHTGIPPGQGPMYREGWEQFYFAPLRAWCGSG